MFNARVLADSLNACTGGRLVTMELTYPRCIHSEFMTHRMFARNAASSRAIPVAKYIDMVEEAPFVPLVWGLNQKGMQAFDEHDNEEACVDQWMSALGAALTNARALAAMGLHKQIVNRVVEPFAWITVIATGVDHAWENFFKLRCHHAAEPHIQRIAYLARHEFDNNSTPQRLEHGQHHLPLTGFPGDDTLSPENRIKVSVARCARVSYLTHDGKRDVSADIELHDRLAHAGHWSPFEHVAKAGRGTTEGGCLGPGWKQYRKLFADEYCENAPRE